MGIYHFEIEDRIRNIELRDRIIPVERAASFIYSGMTIGCSGFVAVGHPKSILKEVASQGRTGHLRLLSGGGTGDECVGELVRKHMVSFLCPYNNNPDARKQINNREIEYVDMHLSDMPKAIRSGMLGVIDCAVIECCAIDENGGIVPTLSVGASEALVEKAEKILLELNLAYPVSLQGIHRMSDGTDCIKCDLSKIVGIVITNDLGILASEATITETDNAIAENVIRIIENECNSRRITGNFSIEPGIGNVAVAVFKKMSELLRNRTVDYVGVVQDGAIDLLLSGNINYVRGAALRLSESGLRKLIDNIDRLKGKISILPQDISNSASNLEECRLIAVNTAIEFDYMGNVNSTHVLGNRIMNGIGGAADFTRHSLLSIFMTPSIAKGGMLSCVVPCVSHVDHSAYDVDFVVTEQGYADLRYKTPHQRAELIISNCSHPMYREVLRNILKQCGTTGYSPFNMDDPYTLHNRYSREGSMHE